MSYVQRQDVQEGNVRVRRWWGTRGCGFSTSGQVARAGLALKVAVEQAGRHWAMPLLEGAAGMRPLWGNRPRVEETAGGFAAAAEHAQRKVDRR